MLKIPGVDAVKVSLNEGMTVLDLHAGNTVTLAQLRKVVKDNGFVSKEAHLSARGTVVERGMQAVLTVAGTGETFALSAGPAANTAFDELRRRAHEAPVMVDELKGTADPPTNRSAVMTVESVR